MANVPLMTIIALFAFFPALSAIDPGGVIVTDMAQYPFMAKFPPYAWPSPVSCSATIIGRKYVMFAAHCMGLSMRANMQKIGVGKFIALNDIKPGLNFSVYVGAPDIRTKDAISIPVKAVAFPPNYPFPNVPYVTINPLDWVRDMAVAELTQPLKYSSKVQPIKLVRHFNKANRCEFENRTAYILGWGGTDEFRLKAGTAKLEPDYVCADQAVTYYNYYRNERNLSTPMSQEQLAEMKLNMTLALKQDLICAGPNPSVIEGGNGGGPLALKVNGEFYQVGVLENILAPGLTNFYTASFVSTRVDLECKWLHELTQGDTKCVELPRERRRGSSSKSSGKSSESRSDESRGKSHGSSEEDRSKSRGSGESKESRSSRGESRGESRED